ncbi:MAG TPA: radical SAM protein [Methylomusa anaerophila]|uniref:Antilisterial bacteriocin subtilosin biosynthesis protein AlbA n=1 Tax=Methylomusa anaerophila TaxID=1930071 RepID=A0A348AJR3_9FIRM|nr:radical SAM protein [Methylomusa anaerophila]BBB91311.1 antilisterial bacteriocin subtilosin biosynthesis protein AlbA [Methylomusa anaerophila]HML90514.1 radical SAM protein [Methylomusa anaerophila]
MGSISHLSSPIHIWWDITRQCNLRCLHCYSCASQRSETELTTEEVFGIIDQLKAMNIGYVYILGGEPLLRSDFDIILDYFSKAQIPLMLNTNGWFVDNHWAEKISESSVKQLRFSVDGCNAETHDALRQKKGSFERVVNAIKICRETSIPLISCSFTITKHNMHEIQPTVDLLAKLGVDQIQFGPISNTGRASEHPQLLLEANDTQGIANILSQCINDYGDKIFIYSVDGIYDKPCTQCVKEGMVKPMFMGCLAGRTCCCIDWEGKVIPCLLKREPVAGSLRETPFQDIWDHAPVFNYMRRHRGAEYPECNECIYGDVCARECPLAQSQKTYGYHERRERIQSLPLENAAKPVSCSLTGYCHNSLR